MAVYNPPKKNLPIFDNLLFIQNTDTVTVDYGNNNYLRYPNAQGTENLQDINVAGDATFYSTSDFNGNVNIGPSATTNLTPVVSTNKAQLNLGNGGNGIVNVACPLDVGGFGSINMTTSNINLTSGAHLTQTSNTTANANTLSATYLSTNYGQSSNLAFKCFDTANNQGISVVPCASVNAFNPLTSAGDVVLFGSGGGVGSKGLNLCSWSATNSGVKILPSSVTIGSGGTTSSPTTGTTYDGTNITLTSTNPPISTATQPASTDSSNKIPTTAWVQSAISSSPSLNPLPYLWMNNLSLNTGSGLLGTVNLNFTGSAWNQNEFFTVRYDIMGEYGATTGNSIYYYNYGGILNIYPNRVPTNGTPNNALLSGSVGGSVPAFGTQYFFSQSYQGSYVHGGTFATNPVYILSTSQTQFSFVFANPNIVPNGNSTLTFTLEILQKGQTGQTITSSGLFGNYFNTF